MKREERDDKNPGLRVPHRVSPVIDPADDWAVLVSISRREERSKKVEEAEEGKEPEGASSEKVFLVGNPDNGTVHAVVKR